MQDGLLLDCEDTCCAREAVNTVSRVDAAARALEARPLLRCGPSVFSPEQPTDPNCSVAFFLYRRVRNYAGSWNEWSEKNKVQDDETTN